MKKVTDDIESMKYNTAIAAMMTLLNQIYDKGSITRGELTAFINILNPFAPHVTEEINEKLGSTMLLAASPWPTYDPAKCVDASVEIAWQVNGKVRGRVTVPADCGDAEAIAAAKENPDVMAFLDGKTAVKELYVKGRLVNIVVK